MSSTLRPSSPPFAFTSSTHIRSASSAALPPPPSVPVCAMLDADLDRLLGRRDAGQRKRKQRAAKQAYEHGQ